MSRVSLPTHDDDGVIDYLEEDPQHPNQVFTVVSMLSPEKIIKQKDQFFFQKFVEWSDYDWKVTGLEKFVAFLSNKYTLKIDDLMKDVVEFAAHHSSDLKVSDIYEKYQVFLLKFEKDIQKLFDIEVKGQCNTRGIKVRRTFGTVEEAETWSKVLKRRFPKDNIFIGRVGYWIPWDPSEHLMEHVEYANQELNDLMRKYKENDANRELFFAEERDGAIKKQKEDNAARKKALAEEGNEFPSCLVEPKPLTKALQLPSIHPSET